MTIKDQKRAKVKEQKGTTLKYNNWFKSNECHYKVKNCPVCFGEYPEDIGCFGEYPRFKQGNFGMFHVKQTCKRNMARSKPSKCPK